MTVIKIENNAVKSVLNGQAKIDKTKVVMPVIKIEYNASIICLKRPGKNKNKTKVLMTGGS